MQKSLKYILFLVIAFLGLYWLVNGVPQAPKVTGMGDLQNTIATVSQGYESYLNKLYTPVDFAKGVHEDPVIFSEQDAATIQYGTHRILLSLPRGQSVTIHFRSIDYATRVYIDGSETGNIGFVGDTKETTTPFTGDYEYTFTPHEEKTEVVLQFANFHHKDGGRPPTLLISSPQNIQHMDQTAMFSTALLVGILLMAFLYHTAMYLMHGRQRATLYFALFCLFFAFRSQMLTPLFFPGWDWLTSLRWEYIDVFTASLFMALFFRAAFPELMSKWVLWGAVALLLLYDIIILFTKPIFFSRLLYFYQPLCGLSVLYVVIRLGMTLKQKRLENTLAFAGATLFFILTVNDILALNNLLGLESANLLPIGTVIFMLAYTIALNIKAEKRERETQTAQIKMEHNLALQAQNYERLTEKIDQAKEARHDLRHHLSVIAALNEKDDRESLKDYLKEYVAAQAEEDQPPVCLNHAVDAVVRHYLSKAAKAGAQIDVQLSLPKEAGVPDADLTVVFGNLFENAANSILRQRMGEKFIIARCQWEPGRLVLTVDNSTDAPAKGKQGTGQSSVISLAQKHGGAARFEQEGSVYRASIML